MKPQTNISIAIKQNSVTVSYALKNNQDFHPVNREWMQMRLAPN